MVAAVRALQALQLFRGRVYGLLQIDRQRTGPAPSVRFFAGRRTRLLHADAGLATSLTGILATGDTGRNLALSTFRRSIAATGTVILDRSPRSPPSPFDSSALPPVVIVYWGSTVSLLAPPYTLRTSPDGLAGCGSISRGLRGSRSIGCIRSGMSSDRPPPLAIAMWLDDLVLRRRLLRESFSIFLKSPSTLVTPHRLNVPGISSTLTARLISFDSVTSGTRGTADSSRRFRITVSMRDLRDAPVPLGASSGGGVVFVTFLLFFFSFLSDDGFDPTASGGVFTLEAGSAAGDSLMVTALPVTSFATEPSLSVFAGPASTLVVTLLLDSVELALETFFTIRMTFFTFFGGPMVMVDVASDASADVDNVVGRGSAVLEVVSSDGCSTFFTFFTTTVDATVASPPPLEDGSSVPVPPPAATFLTTFTFFTLTIFFVVGFGSAPPVVASGLSLSRSFTVSFASFSRRSRPLALPSRSVTKGEVRSVDPLTVPLPSTADESSLPGRSSFGGSKKSGRRKRDRRFCVGASSVAGPNRCGRGGVVVVVVLVDPTSARVDSVCGEVCLRASYADDIPESLTVGMLDDPYGAYFSYSGGVLWPGSSTTAADRFEKIGPRSVRPLVTAAHDARRCTLAAVNTGSSSCAGAGVLTLTTVAGAGTVRSQGCQILVEGGCGGVVGGGRGKKGSRHQDDQ
uniref:Uncharacterized protein n=1 Tax=Anopheles atroparvus TaxID=41427 RepID=A0A182IRZ6_ANOAO